MRTALSSPVRTISQTVVRPTLKIVPASSSVSRRFDGIAGVVVPLSRNGSHLPSGRQLVQPLANYAPICSIATDPGAF